MISIPHISNIEEKVENINSVPELPELSEEEQIKARKKLSEIRASLKNKFSIN